MPLPRFSLPALFVLAVVGLGAGTCATPGPLSGPGPGKVAPVVLPAIPPLGTRSRSTPT